MTARGPVKVSKIMLIPSSQRFARPEFPFHVLTEKILRYIIAQTQPTVLKAMSQRIFAVEGLQKHYCCSLYHY